MARRKVHGDAKGTGERLRRTALPATKGDGRAGVRPDQAQPAHQPVPATRTVGRALGMAADYRHPQPPEAPQAPDSPHSGLKPPLAAPTRKNDTGACHAIAATNGLAGT